MALVQRIISIKSKGEYIQQMKADTRPMRFPVSITYPEANETLYIQDHKLVFQLAEVLNEMNSEVDPVFQVNMIPWIQSNDA